jgi:parallel beta-helix repeat protein
MNKFYSVQALRIAVGITMLGLLLTGSTNAATLTVCSSGCSYSSIQKAIDTSSNGDTILVQSDTYFENLNVTNQLTLRGIGNPIVDAWGSGSAITLSANGITLEGFTATGGGSYPEAGIKVTSSDNTLSGNNASNNDNGIVLSDSSNNTMSGNNVYSNNDYGIVLSDSSNNKIHNNIFNNSKNFFVSDSNINAWNTTRQSGTNIIGGPYLGGNFWANPNGSGFSQTCPDVNGDGICDKSYILDANNIDYLPFARFTAPGITVVSPNGEETWSRGTTQIIRWNYSGTPGSRVNIELMKNGRKNRVITKNTSNDGAYNWSINSTQTLGADYKIRVKSTTNPSYTDKSNKNFIIDDFSVDINKKLILVGVDGFSLVKYKSMYPQLKNFSNIVNNGGWNGTLKITGHNKTTTAPGNAELMTGLNESQNGVSSNKGSKIVDGKTIWERLEVYNSSIVTGSVYGKKTAYITTPLFDNAIPHIDWWQDRKTYGARIWPCGTSVDYDVDVANKATEFIKQYNKNSFFLVVYFASPDGSGHYCGGDTGQSYTDSFINVDKGLGILLNSLKDNGIDTTTQIIITGDHGWNLGTTGHGTANNDTRILPLITNNITMLSNVTSNSLREQGEVAPTILDFFGMTTSDYQDITNEGYQSMKE